MQMKTSQRTYPRLPEAPLASSDPRQAIATAIQTAEYAVVGAPFSPLLINFAAPGDFANIWSSERGDTSIRFYQWNGSRTDGFLPLGDYAVTQNVDFGTTPIMLCKPMPGHEDALAHPTGFTWILDDHGSGNPNDVLYWWPTAPEGYHAVGVAVSNGSPPDVNHYWCVKSSYLQDAGTTYYWSDKGSGWKSHNGDLSFPAISGGSSGANLLLTPTTILSDEYTSDCGGTTHAYALVLDKLFLPVPGFPVPAPTFDPSFSQGSSTAMGIVNVAVIPCNVVVDANAAIQPADCPFYYLAAQPRWVCQVSYSTSEGGKYSLSYSIGTSQTDSKGYANTTSITVSADVGIEAGDAGGFSSHISTSYTHEMTVTVDRSVTHDTETTQTTTINFPPAEVTLIWQRLVTLPMYRTDGSTLSSVDYGASDIRMTHS